MKGDPFAAGSRAVTDNHRPLPLGFGRLHSPENNLAEAYKRLFAERQSHASLNLFALVDGLQYERHFGQRLQVMPGWRALFDGTPDAPLAHAGPWLVDVVQAGDARADELVRLELMAPAVSWLFAEHDLEGLAGGLRRHLRGQDGQGKLLRFWDSRVLAGLAEGLGLEEEVELFGVACEWHFLLKGRRVWVVGRGEGK